jgi:hypothetical protein
VVASRFIAGAGRRGLKPPGSFQSRFNCNRHLNTKPGIRFRIRRNPDGAVVSNLR